MPLLIIESNSLEQKLAIERSPEVLLLTDASDLDHVPTAIRHAADRTSPRSSITPETFRRSSNGSGTIVWLDGETLLDGAPEAIRRNLRHSGRTSFVTLHFPCIANIDL